MGETENGAGNRPPTPPFVLGEWRVEPTLHRISSDRGEHRLEPRFMELLLHLAGRPGEVISRRQLLDAVWPDVVVQEESLTYAISRLRQCLGDDPAAPRYVETIRKGGYRLVAPVRPLHPASGGKPWRWLRFTLPLLIAPAVLWFALSQDADGGRPDFVHSRPLTAYPGLEFAPAVSPDGEWVAFLHVGPGGGPAALHCKRTGEDDSTPLPGSPAGARLPAWSPDARELACVVGGPDESTVYAVARDGGGARELLEVDGAILGLD